MSNKENLPQEMFTVQVTKGQKEFLQSLGGTAQCHSDAESLRKLHFLAVHHTAVPLGDDEKMSLLKLYNIVEMLEQV